MPRRPIVGGNWKCNPEKIEKLPELIANINACDTSKCDVYVCPSPLHVGLCYDKFTNGACVAPQNCNFKGCGAYTGEMAVDQMVDMKMQWCLIGHSERRSLYGETIPETVEKLKASLAAGLSVMFCIGEQLAEREAGTTDQINKDQLGPALDILEDNETNREKFVIAYEPVWAIGTGKLATPEQAQETCANIRAFVKEKKGEEFANKVRIQYGGSSSPDNIDGLACQPDIDGFLVGGASLKPTFTKMIEHLNKM